jgi:hypothetical protein
MTAVNPIGNVTRSTTHSSCTRRLLVALTTDFALPGMLRQQQPAAPAVEFGHVGAYDILPLQLDPPLGGSPGAEISTTSIASVFESDSALS